MRATSIPDIDERRDPKTVSTAAAAIRSARSHADHHCGSVSASDGGSGTAARTRSAVRVGSLHDDRESTATCMPACAITLATDR